MDENRSPRVAEQLRRRRIDAVAVHELGLTGDSDTNHLARAGADNRMPVTADQDFLVMASELDDHLGIVFGQQQRLSIGDWVRGLDLICKVYTLDETRTHVEYL